MILRPAFLQRSAKALSDVYSPITGDFFVYKAPRGMAVPVSFEISVFFDEAFTAIIEKL